MRELTKNCEAIRNKASSCAIYVVDVMTVEAGGNAAVETLLKGMDLPEPLIETPVKMIGMAGVVFRVNDEVDAANVSEVDNQAKLVENIIKNVSRKNGVDQL